MHLSRRLERIGVAIAGLALGSGLAPVLHAQLVRGAVRTAGSGAPVENALVLLLDEHGARLTATLTDSAGRFAFRAAAAGRFALSAERIGYKNVITEPFAVGVGETVERELAAPAVPIALAAITVLGRDRGCKVHPDEGAAAAVVWNEAQKALEATRIAQAQRLYRLTLAHFERDRPPEGRAVLRERSWVTTGISANPFVSAPAESLAAHGYVRPGRDSTAYYAPDAAVLLSESFTDRHCLRMVAGDDEHAGLIGVGFEPVRSRHLPDVKGVLWVDAATAMLRTLEFEYTSLPFHVSGHHAGGRVDFEQLPSGTWIVKRWVIRMPMVGWSPARRGGDFIIGLNELTLLGIREAGGEVRETYTLDGRKVSENDRATIDGTVFDSTRHAPLAHATIALANTGYTTTTDSLGRFMLDSIPQGQYTLTIAHPAFDALGLAPPRVPLSVAPGAALHVTAAIPRAALERARGAVSRATPHP